MKLPTFTFPGSLRRAALGLLLVTAGAAHAQTATFAPTAVYNTGGSYPYSTVTADVNGDGKLDLLTANSGGNGNVGVLLGNGDGTFRTATAYNTGGLYPISLVAADVNGDGKLDLLTVNYRSNNAGVLLGNGTGTFQTATTYNAGGNSPISLAVADVNGDGKLDLLTTNYGSNNVGVLLGNGTGTFQTATTYNTGGSSPYSTVAADVNGDGKLDLLMTNSGSNNVGVLIGNGTGTFQTATTYNAGGNSPNSLAVADVNGDGKLDLLTTNYGSNNAGVLLGNGGGTFQTATTYNTGGSNPTSIVAADVNGDSKLDLLMANSNSSNVGILLGNGTGTFQTATTYNTGTNSYPPGIAVADVNGDGKLDLLTANASSNNVGVLLNTTIFPTPTITSLSPGSGAVGSTLIITGTNLNGATSVRFGELPARPSTISVNAAGTQLTVTVPVLAASNAVSVTTPGGVAVSPARFQVTRANSSVTYAAAGNLQATSGTTTADIVVGNFSKPAVTDLDGDGLLDLVVGNAGGYLRRYEQASATATTFTDLGNLQNGSSVDIQVPSGSGGQSAPTVTDLDGNGHLDLLVGNQAGDVRRYEQVGPGLSTFVDLGLLVATQNNIREAAPTITDLDGNGRLDLLVGNVGGTVMRYEQTAPNAASFGAGTVVSGINVGQEAYPTATDLDGNGLLDLLVGNNGRVVRRYEQTAVGSATFTSLGTFALATGSNEALSPVATDLNGDGLLDLLVGNYAGTVQRFVQTVPPPTITAVSPTPNARAAATTSAVQVTFSKALATSSASALQVFSAQRGGRRTGTMPAVVSGSQLTFTPSAYAFRPGETVSATVTTAAQSTDGGQLAAPRVFQFTTATGGTGRGNFNGGPDVGVGSNPYAIAVGDVDGDGDLDFLTVATSSGGSGSGGGSTTVGNTGTVSVRLNNGAGSFSNAPDVPVGNIPNGIALGDVDGDGNLDFLTANFGSGTVSVRLNNGTGSFSNAPDVPVGTSPNGIALGDVDGDGDLDFLTANGSSSSSTVSVRLNNGTGGFTGVQNVPVGSSLRSVAVGDVDGDGDLDLLAAGSGTVSVRLNDGTGSFTGTQNVPVNGISYNVAVGDVDGDGDLDLLAATGGSSVSVRFNQVPAPTITSLSPTSGAVGSTLTITGANLSGVTSVRFGELPARPSTISVNAAGTQLTVTVPVLAASNTVSVTTPGGVAVSADRFLVTRANSGVAYASVGDLQLAGGGALNVGFTSAPTVTDLDGNGLLDLLVGAGSGYVVRYEQASAGAVTFTSLGNLQAGGTPLKVGTYSAPTVTDLDGNGLLDLLVGTQNGALARYEQTSAGAATFTSLGTLQADGAAINADNYSAPAVTDLDGNGLLDLLVGTQSGYLARFEQTSLGAITFTSRGSLQVGGTTLDVGDNAAPTVTDLDGNGLLDLLVGNSLGNVARYEQASAGATSFVAAAFPLASTQIGSEAKPVVTDLDGDGRLDLLVGNSTGNVARYVQAGPPPTITAVSPTPNARAAAPTSAVQVTFNKALATSSASALKVFSAQRGGLRTATMPAVVSGSQLTFTPSAYAFRPGETVSATVTTATQSTDGGQLATPRVFQFTTAVSPASPGTFSGTQNAGVGSVPSSVAVGDVDGDGDLDLVAANKSGTASVRLNQGNGTFSGGSDVPVSSNLNSVALGDVDGDGDLDLVTANIDNRTVSVRLNNGTGAFGTGSDVPVGDYPRSVVVGDVDGDGDLDLLAANSGNDNVSVCFNNGSGSFGGIQTVPVGTNPYSVVVGDVDGDGDLDLLTANYYNNNNVSVRLNDGTGSFSNAPDVPVGDYPRSVAVGDVDGDGDLDLLAANSSNSVSVRLNNGAGSFSGTQNVGVGYVPFSVAVGDVDGDGDLDLLAANYGGTASVSLNNGSGTFSGTQNIRVGSQPQSIVVGDVDGDGDLDLLTANSGSNSVSVRINQAPALTITAVAPVPNARAAAPTSAVQVTFDKPLAASSTSALQVFSAQRGGRRTGAMPATVSGSQLTFAPSAYPFRPGETVNATVTTAAQNSNGGPLAVPRVFQFTTAVSQAGSGTFGGTQDVGVGIGPFNVVVGDVDGDGDLDLLTANGGSGSVSLRLNQGNGTFSGGSDLPASNNISSVAVGDVDGDGDLDLVMATATYIGTVSVLLNNGVGTFSSGSSVPVSILPVSVILGDVDGDGDLDLLTANIGAASVSVRLNDGTGTFSGTQEAFIGPGSQSITLGDVDGDGDLDLLAAVVGSDNSVNVRLNDGIGNFTGAQNVPVGTNPYSVAVGDVDGDGDLDLLAANLNSNSVSVRLNDGTGTFGSGSEVGVGSNPQSVVVGDVDGDGDLDLLTANSNTNSSSNGNNTVSVRLNQGNGTFSGTQDVPVGTYPQSIVVGDMDGDGDLDLLTANGGGSSVSVRLNQAPAPTITTFSPTSGAVGTQVTITGTNLSGTTLISFSGTSNNTVSTGYTVNAAGTSITGVVVPGGAATGPLSVSTPGGTATSTTSFTVTLPVTAAPVLTSPAAGTTTNGRPTFAGTAPAGSTVTIYLAQGSSAAQAIGTTTAPNGSFGFVPATALASGSYAAYATAQSSGSSASANSNITSFTVDATAPTVTLSTTASSPTSTAPIPFSATFSEPVTGLSASGLSVSNGTVTGNTVSGSGSGPYTFSVTPTGSGPVAVSVAANAAQDAVGNGNVASNAVSVTYAAPATTLTWNGSLSQDWNTAANWTPNQVPTASTDVLIPGTGVRYYPLVPTTGAATRSLTIQATPANTFSLTQGAGTLTVNGTLSNAGTINKSAGTIAVTGDLSNTGGITQSAGDVTVGGSLSNGGTITTAAGTVTVTGNLTNNATFTTGAGTVVLGGGATVSAILGSSAVRFWNLTVQASGAQLSTSVGASVRSVLTLTGNFATNSNVFTLESASTGTALVVNNGSSVVTGNATVQRYIDPSLNSGPGYRHYSAPVSNTTVADLTTTGFTPVVNPAYNTAATPTAVRPFPTVYGYNEQRVNLANSLSAFDRGYVSPTALSDPLTVGRGYTVNLGASQLVDFVGPLNNGPLLLSLTSTRDTNPDGGWQLLGNPYPAPLDYRLVDATDRPGLDGAIYVFSSTSQYGGQYRSFVNGFGNPVLPVGQGFFARVSTLRTSATMTFRNSQRLTAPNNTPFQRTAETRPVVQLTLQGPGSPLPDELFVYFEPGASAGFDGAFDAEKLANPSGLNLASSLATGQGLSTDGRAPLGPGQLVVPLTVGVPAAGSYTLTAAQLLNLSQVPVYLRDQQTGALIDLAQQPSYAFVVSNAAALLTGRFELVFSPQQALATVPAALAEQVGLYPNPATGQVAIELPASLSRQPVMATLLDAVGRPVREQVLPVGRASHTLRLTDLATGVYALRLHTALGTVVRKLVVE